jgi:hypothetical protein
MAGFSGDLPLGRSFGNNDWGWTAVAAAGS